jgi:type I restriction enzyme S subunit
MASRIVKIEDICHVVKGETGIMKAIPGVYPMVGLSEERKTHNEYQFDCKAVIIPLVSSTGHGHASMKRIHYQEGKFALGSILCALVPINEGEYNPEYLYHILDMGKERIFVPLMKGMANVSLPMNRIKSVEINLPSYEEQVRLSKIYSEVTTNIDLLRNQTDKQRNYLKQVRQSIVQLAIQGKLTENWRQKNPIVEPANVLLEKIKAENEKLIQEGKLKRGKPFPRILEAEIPFELPENWLWCRLGAVVNVKSSKRIFASDYKKEGVPFFRSKEIGILGSGYEPSNLFFISQEKYNDINKNFGVPKSGDILLTCVGTIGNTWIVDDRKFYYKDGNLVLIESVPEIDTNYLLHYLRSSFFIDSAMDRAFGSAYKAFTIIKINHSLFPFPPLAEQQAITEIINQAIVLFDELEKKIEKRDSYRERIMHAVVKQAFTTIKD